MKKSSVEPKKEETSKKKSKYQNSPFEEDHPSESDHLYSKSKFLSHYKKEEEEKFKNNKDLMKLQPVDNFYDPDPRRKQDINAVQLPYATIEVRIFFLITDVIEKKIIFS